LHEEGVGQGDELAGGQPGVLPESINLSLVQFPARGAVCLRQSPHEANAAFIEVACSTCHERPRSRWQQRETCFAEEATVGVEVGQRCAHDGPEKFSLGESGGYKTRDRSMRDWRQMHVAIKTRL
jgi:hypothetical protein